MTPTLQHITDTLVNQPVYTAEPYYKSAYDRLTKQIQLGSEYYQLLVKNGIITRVVNMKEA